MVLLEGLGGLFTPGVPGPGRATLGQVYDGFLFEGSEATRGFLLRCWPEVLSNMSPGRSVKGTYIELYMSQRPREVQGV